MPKKSYLTLLDQCFPGMKNNILHCQPLGFSWENSKIFLKEDNNGEAVSHVALLQIPILIERRWYNLGALHAVCTKASHRGLGLSSDLIAQALDWTQKHCDMTILFTEIPNYYEQFSFQKIEEHRFHLPKKYPKGSLDLRPVTTPKDNPLLINCLLKREPLSDRVWIKDQGDILFFNSLFKTYPTFWPLHYSEEIDGFIGYFIKDNAFHLLDVIAKKIPSLDLILAHLPKDIDEVYFYFSPDKLTDQAVAQVHLYDKGYLMAHGAWPTTKPFMISPLSRC